MRLLRLLPRPALSWLSLLAGLVAEAVFAPDIAVAKQLKVKDLGTLGGNESVARAINRRSEVVGGAETADGDRHAFLWRAGKMTDLGTLDPTDIDSLATDINDLGQLVGFSVTAGSDPFGFLWDGSMHYLQGFGHASGINNLGAIAGSVGLSAAVVRLADGTTYSPTLGGSFGFALDINNLNQVAGWGSIVGNSADHAFIWSPDSGILDIGTLGGGLSEAYGINDRGEVVGSSRSTSPGWRAFIWSEGTMTELGAGPGSYAYGINNLGDVVGSADGRAFLWSDGVLSDLNSMLPPTSLWTLETAYDINDVGEIVGLGTRNGKRHAFLAALPRKLTYYALGDSVAAGHGLPIGDGQKLNSCRRNTGAYPWRVHRRLRKLVRYKVEKNFQDGHLACSGARSFLKKKSPDWQLDLPEQVNAIEDTLKTLPAERVVLVSLTVGANDFDFVKQSFLGTNICLPQAEFDMWVQSRADKIQVNVTTQLERIFAARDDVYVILTDYFNPFNSRSQYFETVTTIPDFPPIGNSGCKDANLTQEQFRQRTDSVVNALNGALDGVASGLAPSDKQRFARAMIYADFVGHESAMPNCGKDPPVEQESWIQYAGFDVGTFWSNGSELDDVLRMGNDCFHPTSAGQETIAKAVYQAAIELLP